MHLLAHHLVVHHGVVGADALYALALQAQGNVEGGLAVSDKSNIHAIPPKAPDLVIFVPYILNNAILY